MDSFKYVTIRVAKENEIIHANKDKVYNKF